MAETLGSSLLRGQANSTLGGPFYTVRIPKKWTFAPKCRERELATKIRRTGAKGLVRRCSIKCKIGSGREIGRSLETTDSFGEKGSKLTARRQENSKVRVKDTWPCFASYLWIFD